MNTLVPVDFAIFPGRLMVLPWLATLSCCIAYGKQQPAVVRKQSPQVPVESLIQELGGDRFAEREAAERALIAVGPAALPKLYKAAEGQDPEVARRAKTCIQSIKRNAQIAPLIKALQHPDPQVRLKAAEEIWVYGPDAQAAVPVLLKLFDDSNTEVRDSCCVALFHIAPTSDRLVPKLMDIAKNQKETERSRSIAMDFLTNIGPRADVAVPFLLETLRNDKNGLIRATAASTLARLGTNESKKVVPALIAALGDSDIRVQGAAVGALGVLGKEPELALKPIMDVFNKYKRYGGRNDPRVCAMGVTGFGPKAKPVVPMLLEVFNDSDEKPQMRICALRSLIRLGPTAKEALPFIKAELERLSVFPPNDLKAAVRAIEVND